MCISKSENRLHHGNFLADVLTPPYGENEPDIGEWTFAHQNELSQFDRQLFDEFSGKVVGEQVMSWKPSLFERSGAFDPEAYSAFKEVSQDYTLEELCEMAVSQNVSPTQEECDFFGHKEAIVEKLAEKMGMEDLTVIDVLPVKHWTFTKEDQVSSEDISSCQHEVIHPTQSLWEKAKFKVLSTIECAVVEGEIEVDHTESIRISRGSNFPEVVGRMDVEWLDEVPYEMTDEGEVRNNPLGYLVRKILKAIIAPHEDLLEPTKVRVKHSQKDLSIPEMRFLEDDERERFERLCERKGISFDKIPDKVVKLDEQGIPNYRGFYRPRMELKFDSLYSQLKWLTDMKFYIRWANGGYSPRGFLLGTMMDAWPVHYKELNKLLDLARANQLNESILSESLQKMDKERLNNVDLKKGKDASEAYLWLVNQIKEIQKKYPCYKGNKVQQLLQRRIKVTQNGKSNLVSPFGFLKIALWRKLNETKASVETRVACWNKIKLFEQNYRLDLTNQSPYVSSTEVPGFLKLKNQVVNTLFIPFELVGQRDTDAMRVLVKKSVLEQFSDKLIEDENAMQDITDSFNVN